MLSSIWWDDDISILLNSGISSIPRSQRKLKTGRKWKWWLRNEEKQSFNLFIVEQPKDGTAKTSLSLKHPKHPTLSQYSIKCKAVQILCIQLKQRESWSLMEEKRKSKLWLKKVSWPFRWKPQKLQTTIVDTVLFKILSLAEAVVLVSTLCFFYLCCGCHF